jgi:hypothetical protein
MKQIIVLTFGCAALFCGCASSKKEAMKPVYERPWIGGHFEMTDTPHSLRTNSQKFGKHGALVTTVHKDSPLDKAGLQEADLVLAVNGERVRTEKRIYQRIGKTGAAPATFTIYRDGEISEKPVVPGKERFQKYHLVMFKIGLGTGIEFDLFPNPDFSLFALGYETKSDRLDLKDAKSKFRRDLKVREGRPEVEDGWTGLHSEEGWKTWLGPISFEERKVIVSQE